MIRDAEVHVHMNSTDCYCFLLFFIFQIAIRMLRPYGMKSHQLREKDINEISLSDFDTPTRTHGNMVILQDAPETSNVQNIRLMSHGQTTDYTAL